MIRFKWYESGDLFGVHYTFEKAGDALPNHAHARETLHNVIVLKGAIRECDTIVQAGNVHDFDGSQLHLITALIAGTQILNLFLHGKPADYNTLPESEKTGVLNG